MNNARLIGLLHLLIGGTAIVSMVQTVYVFQSDLPLVLEVNGEYWTRKISEFVFTDRLVIISLIQMSELAWFWALYKMWSLARLYSGGQFFTPQNSQCFIGIGNALMLMAVLETLLVPALSGYLYGRGVIDSFVDLDLALLFSGIDLMTAGLFCLLIGSIMEKASALQEDADMTI